MENASSLVLPVIFLRQRVVFPYSTPHINVSQPASVKACDWAQREGSDLFLVAQKDARLDAPLPNQIYQVGVVAEIHTAARSRTGGWRLHLKAKQRATWRTMENRDGIWLAALQYHLEENVMDPTREALLAELTQTLDAYLHALPSQMRASLATAHAAPEEAARHLTKLTNYATQLRTDLQFEHTARRVDKLAQHLHLDITQGQSLIESLDLDQRIQRLIALLKQRAEPSLVSLQDFSPSETDHPC